MDLVSGLLILTNWKCDTYDSIFVIVDQMTKIIDYKPIKITIDAPSLVEAIDNVIIKNYSLSDLIISNYGSVSISKFWFSLCSI